MSRKKNTAEKEGEQSGLATLMPPGTATPGTAQPVEMDLFTRVDTHRQQDVLALEEALKENQQREAFIQNERSKILERLQLLGVQVRSEAPTNGAVLAAPRQGTQKIDASGLSLGDALVAALQQAGGPLSVMDLTAKVQAMGYKSESKNFRSIISQTLSKQKETFKNAGRGVYDLKNRAKTPMVGVATSAPAVGSAKLDQFGKGLRPGSATSKVLGVIQRLGKNVSTSDIRAEMKRSHSEVNSNQISSALVQLRGPMKDGKQTGEARVHAVGQGTAVRYTANI